MQGTAVASGRTRQLYVHNIMMWRIVLNAAVTITIILKSHCVLVDSTDRDVTWIISNQYVCFIDRLPFVVLTYLILNKCTY